MKHSIAVLLLFGTVVAVRASAAGITARNAWVREPNPAHAITAAYLTLHNGSDAANALIGASTPDAKTVELHRMKNENGVMRMQQVSSIELPRHSDTHLQPGGYHLMVFDLTRKLAVGDVVSLTLRFRDGSTQVVKAPVRNPE